MVKRGHAWQREGGMCGEGGMDDRGTCMAGGVHCRGHVWQGVCVAGGMCGWGHV